MGIINEEQLQAMLSYLDKIAAKLNIGVHEVWPWFIKQQFVDAYAALSFLLISTFIAAILLLSTIRLWRKGEKYDNYTYYYEDGKKVTKTKDEQNAYSIYHKDHEPGWVIANIICMIMILFAGVIFYMQFFDIFNPEYSAFKDLLSTVKPLL